MQKNYLLVFLIALVGTNSHAGIATKLFSEHKQRVYQVRVVDVASGDKSSIGSGFQVTADGHLATNFHVVSSYVHKPDKYRLEAVDSNNVIREVTLLDIDVIHDLAIIKLKQYESDFFTFNSNALSKGDRIYSMGNPHDLGMTIIEGNYNGLLEKSRYKKILFSGSLNAGMSGGPAFDGMGNIIGVNVSKGSEQLSFLVPVKELDQLLRRALTLKKPSDFESSINSALIDDQNSFYGELFLTEWDVEKFVELKLPSQLSDSLKCWGHSVDEKDILYKAVHQHCHSQDVIYLSENLSTGLFFYDYEWMSGKELNRFQFYEYVQDRYQQGSLNNGGDKEDVTNYNCSASFVTISDHSWKVTSCIRTYKKYPGLYDTLMLLTTVDENDSAMLVKFGAAGISKENSIRLVEKFIGNIQWQH